MIFNFRCRRGLCYSSSVQCPTDTNVGTLSKLRRKRQRERGETKYIMSRTFALHCIMKLCIIFLMPLLYGERAIKDETPFALYAQRYNNVAQGPKIVVEEGGGAGCDLTF